MVMIRRIRRSSPWIRWLVLGCLCLLVLQWVVLQSSLSSSLRLGGGGGGVPSNTHHQGGSNHNNGDEDQGPPHPPHPPPPYAIVVGLPKSGTTSIYHFFQCLGYSTTHYCCCGTNATEYPCQGGRRFSQILSENIAQGNPLFAGTGGTPPSLTSLLSSSSSSLPMVVHAQLDGETDTPDQYFLPQHSHLELLDASAPEAIWILPLRPAAKWKRSVEGWLDMANRLETSVHPPPPPNDVTAGGGEGGVSSVVPQPAFDLESFYNAHTQRIRDYCRVHRSSPSLNNNNNDRCIEVEIDDPQAGVLLTQRFASDESRSHHASSSLSVSSCWGKHNAGPFFQAFAAKPVVTTTTAATGGGGGT